VQPEHVNNQEEETLLTKTLNYLVPTMEKAFKEEDYLTAVDIAQTVIYNGELIKAAFVQAPQSYLRSLIAQKFMEFSQLIAMTREKGRFDAILPIFYYEKAAGPIGEPSRMIASANLSVILIGVMEKELRPTAMFTT
jgi:tRNA(Glu) U13 pseudouridine synthase TruD